MGQGERQAALAHVRQARDQVLSGHLLVISPVRPDRCAQIGRVQINEIVNAGILGGFKPIPGPKHGAAFQQDMNAQHGPAHLVRPHSKSPTMGSRLSPITNRDARRLWAAWIVMAADPANGS